MNRGYGYADKPMGYSNVSRGYSNREEGFGEVQFMLENERRKFKEAKDKFQFDLDNERKLRIEFQNKLIKLKDQFSKKDVSISELQFKINNLLHQNQDIIVENDRLKHEIARLQELYGSKIHQLQGQLALQSQNCEEITQQYKDQFQKFKKQGQQYVQQITFDFERKLKSMEERAKVSQTARRDLVMQNKKLNDILVSNKLAFEEEVREIKNRSRDQEIKKSQMMVKSFQQKLKLVQQNKQSAARKNQQLLRALQDKDRHLGDLETERNEELGKLRQDNTDLHQQINHLTFLLTKVKGELAEKDTMIGRSINDSDSELNHLRMQLENKKQEMMQMASRMRDMERDNKEIVGEGERKRRELSERANLMENQARKYKDEYLRICEMLKSKINHAIDNVSIKK